MKATLPVTTIASDSPIRQRDAFWISDNKVSSQIQDDRAQSAAANILAQLLYDCANAEVEGRIPIHNLK